VIARCIYLMLFIGSVPALAWLSFEVDFLTLLGGPQNLFFGIAHGEEWVLAIFFPTFIWSARCALLFAAICLVMACIPPFRRTLRLRPVTLVVSIVWPLIHLMSFFYYQSWVHDAPSRMAVCLIGLMGTTLFVALPAWEAVGWFRGWLRRDVSGQADLGTDH
jgi:hypothetical protein